jgi:hypothetical protein
MNSSESEEETKTDSNNKQCSNSTKDGDLDSENTSGKTTEGSETTSMKEKVRMAIFWLECLKHTCAGLQTCKAGAAGPSGQSKKGV